MLEKRTYSRKQLIDLYQTNRLDAIKNKIKRQEYQYIDSGRGDNYYLTITNIPQSIAFKQYCINVLGFSSQTDFDKLKSFLKFILEDREHIKLQYSDMHFLLKKDNIEISAQTLSYYCKQLIEIGWIFEDWTNYVYYYYDYDLCHNIYISKQEYRKIYRNYWIIYYQNRKFQDAEYYIYSIYGNKPKKRPLRVFNGIYVSQMNEIKKLIQKG